MWLLLVLGICLPVGTNLVVNYALPAFCQVRVIAHDTRDFLLSLFQSVALAIFMTQFIKNITGRFRPCFYDMCKWNHDVVWDGITNLCTYTAGEKEGRKSFPSGHASFAWSTMLVLTDPSIDHQKLTEEVPMWLLVILAVSLPVGANLIVNFVLPAFCQVRVIAHDTRDFLLSLFQSMALAEFLTQLTKNIIGRFRPSFYGMCGWNFDVVWDGVANLCTDESGEKEGRRSFPSGHASCSWASMLTLTLYLLGRSRLNCSNYDSSVLRRGRKTPMALCCLPLLLAVWVCVARSIDNWHHYSDILAGSVIGAVAAVLAFNSNYGSIFSWEFSGLPVETIHEQRKQTQKVGDVIR
ncbi:Phosphatidic acid phosphatase [Phytophthora cinnamomi]|uniref:Phosphatidic acid phosphatase n=1 Tax=Phytophthora cinnamomi TaxID=4785 RepID=UPI00355ACA37|nr:Phosphatidic acid phosphatase [Phytophthora cinnamomi]